MHPALNRLVLPLFALSYLAFVRADCNITCPVGNYKSQVDAYSNATCSLCPPGTYNALPTRAKTCSPCPANFYCVSSSSIQPCPAYTHCEAGSSSVLQCRCDSGYACSYSKRIVATVVLNSTLTDFNANYNNVRSDLIDALAYAAGVSREDVVIDAVVGQAASRRRRILSLAKIQELTSAIHVHVHINGADRLMNLDLHLGRVSPVLHISHNWEEAHDVSTLRNSM